MKTLKNILKNLLLGIPSTGENASPKGLLYTICPESYLQEWKINDVNKISNNIIYIK